MVNKCFVLVFPVLLVAAAGSSAMSLGRQSGQAIIGRPLDISIPIVLGAEDRQTEQCFAAEVFFGDNSIDGSRVRITAQPSSASSDTLIVNIRSTVQVDEPVVTIALRAGCQTKIERRYTLLADLASTSPQETAANPNQAASNVVVVPGSLAGGSKGQLAVRLPETSTGEQARQNQLNSASSSSSTSPNGRNEATFDLKAKNNVSQSRVNTSANLAQARRNARVTQTNPARLKLEPLDLTVTDEPNLRLTPELFSTPTTDEQQRTLAAAIWRALNAQPEEILQDAQKLLGAQKTVAELQAEIQKNKLAVNDLNIEIQRAQSERYFNLIVYALAALLTLALIAIAYLWRFGGVRHPNRSSDSPWWKKNKSDQAGWATGLDRVKAASAADKRATQTQLQAPIGKTAKKPSLDLDLSSTEQPFGVFKRKHDSEEPIPPLGIKDRPEFVSSMAQMARAVKAEELLDVQQQADFFVSLGQHEQAIEVLQDHISVNAETSVLIYLDLFNLFHLLKREEDYAALRDSFSALFNVRMPEFALYKNDSPGLEAYPAALARIEALWPSPKVLEVIEESIFKRQNADTEAFDLGAYRELLLLYAVAKDVIGMIQRDREDMLPSLQDLQSLEGDGDDTSFPVTSIQPLSANVANNNLSADEPLLSFETPVFARTSSLDIDLTQLINIKQSGNEIYSVDELNLNQLTENSAFTPATENSFSAVQPFNYEVNNLIDFELVSSKETLSGAPKLLKE